MQIYLLRSWFDYNHSIEANCFLSLKLASVWDNSLPTPRNKKNLRDIFVYLNFYALRPIRGDQNYALHKRDRGLLSDGRTCREYSSTSRKLDARSRRLSKFCPFQTALNSFFRATRLCKRDQSELTYKWHKALFISKTRIKFKVGHRRKQNYTCHHP